MHKARQCLKAIESRYRFLAERCITVAECEEEFEAQQRRQSSQAKIK